MINSTATPEPNTGSAPAGSFATDSNTPGIVVITRVWRCQHYFETIFSGSDQAFSLLAKVRCKEIDVCMLKGHLERYRAGCFQQMYCMEVSA